VSLKLLYNDNKGCHSRENGNPAEKTGFRIKSGMTFCVKSFLKQYNSLFVMVDFQPPFIFYLFFFPFSSKNFLFGKTLALCKVAFIGHRLGMLEKF